MKWILNLAYACLLLALSPVIIWRCVRHGRYRKGLSEKLFGRLPQFEPDDQVVWFHAVSVGEVLQLEKLVESFRASSPATTRILISTSTDTGHELACKRFTDCNVTWFPLDFSWAVSNALERVKPNLFVLVELELWPNFLIECRRRGIKTSLVNARMSDRSFRGYSRIRPLISPIFQSFTVIAAQNSEYASRLKDLGGTANATSVTGSIKFDGVSCDKDNQRTQELRRLLQIVPEESVFIAGSTQSPEEDLALQAYAEARNRFPNLRLILVPRHRERFDEVANLVEANQFRCVRRSQLRSDDVISQDAVVVLDTIGELSACWGLADVAFVGGSFGSRGGQNMLEPAAFGAAVMFGPKTRNFREIVKQLLTANAGIELLCEDKLQEQLVHLLQNPQQRQAMGEKAQQVIAAEQGAISRTTQLLLSAVDLNSPADKHSQNSFAA